MFWLQQQSTSFDPISMWHNMGYAAKGVVVVLFAMSVLSIGVMVDRWLVYSAARRQSREFAPAVAGALKDGRLDEAFKIAERNKKSHLAKVVTAGLSEFQAHQVSADIPGEEIEASRRALDRAEAIEHAELKRGLGSLATIGATAPFVGLFGTVLGIIHAFTGIAAEKAAGLAAVSGGISEALVTTAIGLFVAIPAVWAYNYFTGKVEAFDIEMDNSSSELIDYFLKRSGRSAAVRSNRTA
jgi:biopolymer transport protein ExbB/biopolymer transport protein TolQ